MPPTFRLATFNVENLFARYRFDDNLTPSPDGFTINAMAFDIYDEAEKRITGQAIKEVNADVLCLQEVESLPVLDRFCSAYLSNARYTHRILVDGNDPRYIDVAVLSRFPLRAIRTHRHERRPGTPTKLFSRDCLEVEVQVDPAKGPFILYVNHFKSMLDQSASDGRAATRDRRLEQVARVAAIIDEVWQAGQYEGNFAVAGDFNDYVDAQTSLTALVSHPALVNVLDNAPAEERWTHFYKGGGGEYRQLDYILLARPLYERAGRPVPFVMRKGLPLRATRYVGPRFPGIGQDDPKASDHAPLVVDLPLSALR